MIRVSDADDDGSVDASFSVSDLDWPSGDLAVLDLYNQRWCVKETDGDRRRVGEHRCVWGGR